MRGRGKPYEPAKNQVYKRYLYLDGDEILDSLSGLEGGDVESIVDKVVKDRGADAGLEISGGAAKLKLGGSRKRQRSQELTRKRTSNSAVEAFLGHLQRHEGLSIVSECDIETYGKLAENETVLIETRLGPCIPGVDREAAPPSFWSRLGGAPQPRTAPGTALLVGRAGWGAPSDKTVEVPVLLELDWRFMLARPEQFDRQASVVGQIRWILGDGETCLWDERQLVLRSDDRGGLEVGHWQKPALVVNPLCIYK